MGMHFLSWILGTATAPPILSILSATYAVSPIPVTIFSHGWAVWSPKVLLARTRNPRNVRLAPVSE